jgi:hypothetical protein
MLYGTAYLLAPRSAAEPSRRQRIHSLSTASETSARFNLAAK